MRVKTVSQMKGTSHELSDEPAEGTLIRKYYDKLLINRGEWIFIQIPGIAPKRQYNELITLRDNFGLEIETKRHGCKPSEYRLRGEWFGKIYVSYLKD